MPGKDAKPARPPRYSAAWSTSRSYLSDGGTRVPLAPGEWA